MAKGADEPLPAERKKRAFSISKESTKNLEAALKKKRRSMKHCCTLFTAFFYSIYLIILKQQEKPPKRRNYSIYFALALLISCDMLVSLSYAFHVTYPTFLLVPEVISYLFIYAALPAFSILLGITSVSLPFANFLLEHLWLPHPNAVAHSNERLALPGELPSHGGLAGALYVRKDVLHLRNRYSLPS